MTTKNQKGFTLVEIAIVLVIIGLLLGGVLKGQELIQSAKIKSAVQEMKSFQAAVYTFQDKYKYLPGDYNNAAGLVYNGIAVNAGNQNGLIAGNAEIAGAFRALVAANLISGAPDATNGRLPGKIGGTVTLSSRTATPFVGQASVCYTALTKDQAEALDIAIDGVVAFDQGDFQAASAYAATNTVCFRIQ